MTLKEKSMPKVTVKYLVDVTEPSVGAKKKYGPIIKTETYAFDACPPIPRKGEGVKITADEPIGYTVMAVSHERDNDIVIWIALVKAE
jgi:hypothetical protein